MGYSELEGVESNVARLYCREASKHHAIGNTIYNGHISCDHVRLVESKGKLGLNTVGTGIPRYEPLYTPGSADPHNIINLGSYKIRGKRDTTD